MKRFLMTLAVLIAFGGSIFAQNDSDTYSSHWDDFNGNLFENQDPTVAFIRIGEDYVSAEGNWEDYEVAAFVGTECRGHSFLRDYTDLGDPYPILEIAIYYNSESTGETVSFQMFDHANEILYEECFITTYGDPTTPAVILTAEDHTEAYFGFEDDYASSIVLAFTAADIPPVEPWVKEVVIEGYGEGEGHYYFIASPFDGTTADVEGLLTDEYDLYYFDQNEEYEWRWNGDDLVIGRGYLYASKETTTLIFTGEENTADEGEVLLTKTEGTGWEGWNVVGNPLTKPAYIDRAYYTLNNSSNYIECTAADAIDAAQGILVKAENDEEPLLFTAGEPTKSANLNLNLTQNGNLIDRASVNFSNGNQLPKIQLFANSTKVYIPQDNKDYAVVRADEMGEMPVNFKAQENGTYTFSFSNQNVEFGYLHLIDNRTGNDVDLIANPSYTFDANTTDYASRFKLVFATGNNLGDDFAFISDGNIIVNGNGTLQVFDVTGRMINSSDVTRSISTNV